jgi:hypothetical protein
MEEKTGNTIKSPHFPHLCPTKVRSLFERRLIADAG